MSASTVQSKPGHGWWTMTLVAAAILMVTMGTRQSLGLFVSPLNTATGLGIVTISFALAVGQFVWGAVQPVAGALADRYGPGRVLAGSLVVLAIGCALTPLLTSAFGLMLTMGILFAAGAGGAGFSVLIGSAAQHVPANKRGTAAGVINAGGSFGQFVFAPLAAKVDQRVRLGGCPVVAGRADVGRVAVDARVAPLAGSSGGSSSHRDRRRTQARRRQRVQGPQLSAAACGILYVWLSHCISGHPLAKRGRPVRLAGIGRKLVAGADWTRQYCWQPRRRPVGQPLSQQVHPVLDVLFAHRADSDLPGSAEDCDDLLHLRDRAWRDVAGNRSADRGRGRQTVWQCVTFATLFGLTLLTHQIGAFFGAYLGGIAVDRTGSYLWMWYADALLALAAALVNLPIREPKIERQVPA